MQTSRIRSAGVAVAVALALSAGSAQAQSHAIDAGFSDGLEDGPGSRADAARFLAQATFGATDADITEVMQLGYAGWLAKQYAAPVSSQLAYYNWVTGPLAENYGSSVFREGWFLAALGGPDPRTQAPIPPNHTDQLRQRVAFALSEIFVVSDKNTLLDQHPDSFAHIYDIFANNAFGNYRTLLDQVTLSPAMGVYLNMMTNHRANLAVNLHPDENYAREINQLFSVGLVMLNPDGTVQTSGGQPVPTYNQAVITNFAHVFTGWTWSGCTTAAVFDSCGPDNSAVAARTPMIPIAAQHDNGTDVTNDILSKQLLSYGSAASGGVVPNGGTPAQDLAFALDNIFNHPNVGPFIGKQLIQRLVTSNPSPAYVARVTAVFNNNGSGVRGDLKAVVQAILLDPEARYGHLANPSTYGKLREPLLRITHLWRAMSARHACGSDTASGNTIRHYGNMPYRYAGYATAYATDDTIYESGVGQAPLDSDTVFNFFKPSFKPPGEMSTAGLVGPEFQINTDVLNINSTNSMMYKAFGYDLTDTCDNSELELGEVKINTTQDLGLAGLTNGQGADTADRLIDAYNVRFMSGQMSAFMRKTLLDNLNAVNVNSFGADWKRERVSRALYLILTSPEYMVQK